MGEMIMFATLFKQYEGHGAVGDVVVELVCMV